MLLLLVALFTDSILAQSHRGELKGVIVDQNKQTIIGAAIQLRNESTGFATGTISNENGEYYIKQIPLGGPYSIRVSFIGFGDQEKSGYTINQGDVITVNFELAEESFEVETVEVVANSLKNTVNVVGGTTSVTTQDLNRLPVNGRNFSTLIDISPLSTGTSLAGQLSTSTNFTIDGMTAKNPTSGGSTTSRNSVPYAISMEAIREFKVVTNQYDVTTGRAGGGGVSTVTRSGTNLWNGALFCYLRTDWLSSRYDIRGNKRDNEFSTYQYGATLSGPIVKDRAHFFVSWDHQQDKRPLEIANIKSDADQITYKISRETRDKYLDIARKYYGVSGHGQFGSFDKKQGTDAAFARIDWQINPTNLLTVTDNFVYDMNNMGLSDNSSINLYEVYGNVKSMNNALTLNLRSLFGPQITNELKFQHLHTLEKSMPGDELPSVNIPRAIVERVESEIDGKKYYTTVQLGGQRYSPENFFNNVYQVVDNMYYNRGKYNYTFGFDLMYSHLNSRYGSETNGRFYFNGLDNFENLTPYRYVREVYTSNNERVKQNILNIGVYGQVETSFASGLELMLGLRFDYAKYFNHGDFNQTVYDELGLRTDNGMKTLHVQPRFQLQWDVNNQHKDYIKVGGGIFASDINNYAMINNMVFDGTRTVSLDISDAANIPTPDFASYRKDPSTAPGKNLLSNEDIEKITTINMNGSDCKVPVVYKANISYNHFFSDKLKAGLSAYYTTARNNYMYVDRNIVDDPYFRIASEGNRGVYVPAESIPASGNANWVKGRKSEKVGRVLEMNSEGKTNQYAFVADATWRYYKDGQISVSYTWNDAKDNTSYTGNVANSATLSLMVKDDPRDLSHMTYSNNQYRHKLVVYGSAPSFYGINVGMRFSGTGGTRYSMIVNGNVNGDFVSTNDLAYVFDPNSASTPDNIRNGINDILANPKVSKSFKDYLKDSFGKVAERNGGENGFYGTVDLRISKKVYFGAKKKQNLEISADIFNFMNMLNKDWGVNDRLGSQYLYTISGFDQEKKEYTYNVNASAGIATKSGNPYQIQVGLRYGF